MTHAAFAVESCPPSRLAELFALRAQVWIGEGADPAAFPTGAWSDEHDAHRLHWIVCDADRLVAGASMSLHDRLEDLDEPEAFAALTVPTGTRIAAPARIVVAATHRGGGIAQALLDTQDAAAIAAGARYAVRQASPAMRRLLERRGWQVHGPGPDDPRFPGIAFTVMSKMLA